jgi:hypothetical protein
MQNQPLERHAEKRQAGGGINAVMGGHQAGASGAGCAHVPASRHCKSNRRFRTYALEAGSRAPGAGT